MRLQVMATKSIMTVFAMVLACDVYAQDVTLNIVDQYGQPLTNAVITFENQGVVVLGCNIHDSMLGYIYVAKSADVYQSDEHGNVQLSGLNLPVQLTIWHALQKNALEAKQPLTLAVNSPHSLQVTLQTTEPKPRNTFGSKFKGGND